ncbi:hypothetical protein CO046_04140, partial [Candidatus Peregrinibacteria bacterium CG_4_9_14_0_2_um_filter_53_11]
MMSAVKIKTKPTAERTGELYVIAETIIYALFPILVAHTTRLLPPILFAALSTLAAALSLLVYVLVKKQFSYLENKQFV